MTAIVHDRFTVERTYPQVPSRVFELWSDPEQKARWFCGPAAEYELDFRIGGQEVNRDGTPGGPGYTYIARYSDIVEEDRIVYTYEMHAADVLASVSVATVEFDAEQGGTRVAITEQIALLDSRDTAAARERGTQKLLGRIAEQL